MCARACRWWASVRAHVGGCACMCARIDGCACARARVGGCARLCERVSAAVFRGKVHSRRSVAQASARRLRVHVEVARLGRRRSGRRGGCLSLVASKLEHVVFKCRKAAVLVVLVLEVAHHGQPPRARWHQYGCEQRRCRPYKAATWETSTSVACLCMYVAM